jgi:hypothetical protein
LRYELPLTAEPRPIEEWQNGEKVASRPGKPLKAVVLVEEGTGRVLTFQPDFEYWEAKHLDIGKPSVSELVSKEKAWQISESVLAQARVSLDGLKRGAISLIEPKHGAYWRYVLTWEKYVKSDLLGPVQSPFTLFMQIDALTGELDGYRLTEFPISAPLDTPTISADSAVDAARAGAQVPGLDVVDRRLKIDFDYTGVRQDDLMQLITAPEHFYEKVQRDRQVLVWQVTLSGQRGTSKWPPEMDYIPSDREVRWIAKIGCKSGKVLKLERYP